jgi:hypothetical protein
VTLDAVVNFAAAVWAKRNKSGNSLAPQGGNEIIRRPRLRALESPTGRQKIRKSAIDVKANIRQD